MAIAMEERKPNGYVSESPTETEGALHSASTHGFSIWVAALFLLGALAGAGIMAMPYAFLQAGWWAVPMVVIMCVVGCLTGFQLSWCWTMLQEKWPEYSEHTRNPYPEIAERAGGKVFKYAVQICVHLSMLGAAIAFLILSSNNISHLIEDWFGWKIDFCYMVLIIGGCLLPILFLGTPKDFWPIAFMAISATTLAILFIIVGTIIDMPTCHNKVYYPPITVKGFISAYCTISFAYGGHSAFPTIQHDMRQPAKFPISIIIAFAALFVLYLPMPVMAYSVYGNTIQGTIDQNLSTRWVRDVIMILITGHVLFAFFIVLSPVVQDFERVIGIPLQFSWKRMCTRTIMMSFIIFIALSIPDFNALLELVGGTALASTAYIFPGPLYLMLKQKVQSDVSEDVPEWKRQTSLASSSGGSGFFSHISAGGKIPIWQYTLTAIVVTCGVIGAIAAVYGVFSSGATLLRPCYVTGMQLQRKMTAMNITHCWDNNNVQSTMIDS